MKSKIALLSFVLIGYAISRTLPHSNRDIVAFVMLFFCYIVFLLYRRFLLKIKFGRYDALMGIPAIYGLGVSILQYNDYLKVGNVVVWIVFILIAIVSLGYINGDRGR